MAVTFSGKDKVQKYARAYVSGYDISGDAIAVSELANSLSEVDLSGWSNALMQWDGGLRTAGIRGFQAIMNATAGQSLTAIQTPNSAKNVIIAFGGGGEPAIGDPSYHLIGFHRATMSNIAGGRGLVTAEFDPAPSVSGWSNPLGRLQYPAATQLTETTNGASVDWGADLPKTNGASAMLMVLATSSGNFAFKIQDSADDDTFGDYITFTINGSAVATEYKTEASTMLRYTRFVATRTAGSVYVVCSLAVNNVFQIVA